MSDDKSLVVVVRHVDKMKEYQSGGWKEVRKDSFLKLIEVKQYTFGDLHTAVTNLLYKEIAVPKQNLVGFASDKVSVMMEG